LLGCGNAVTPVLAVVLRGVTEVVLKNEDDAENEDAKNKASIARVVAKAYQIATMSNHLPNPGTEHPPTTMIPSEYVSMLAAAAYLARFT